MDNKNNIPLVNKTLLDQSNKVEYAPVMKKDNKVNDIQTILLQKVYMIANYEKYKFSLDLVKYLMNQLELLVSKSDGIDKKQIVINIMQKIFNLNAQEVELIDHFVEFIWEHRLIVKNSIFNCFNIPKKKL
jgi:hypothetical protein